MGKRHTGNCVRLGSETVNLNRCQVCGTSNPSIPGDGLPESCAGCGTPLPRDNYFAPAKFFTPPRKDARDAEDLENAHPNTRRRHLRQTGKIAAFADGRSNEIADGAIAPEDRKTAKSRKRTRF